MDTRALPFLGLGLSSNLDPAVEPDPWRLHAADPGLLDLVEYSAPLALEEAERDAGLFGQVRRGGLPVLFHPVHLNLAGPALEPPDALAALDVHARAVGSAWVGNDVAWWHVRGQALPGYLYVPPPLDAHGLAVAEAHARSVAAALSVPLALENPAVVRREGPLHVLDFMAELHARTGLPLVLDVGHLLASQLAAGLPADAALDGYAWDAVIEVHVAGGVVSRLPSGRGVYVDDHGQPLRGEVLDLLAGVLPRCRHLRALVFEGDGHPPAVAAATLRRLRALLAPLTPALRDAEVRVPAGGGEGARPALPPGAEARAWASFSAAHGAPRPGDASPDRPEDGPDDPEGMAAEVALRAAVTAEALDARWPLSRWLLAPDRARLVAFLGSDAFRSAWAEGRPLDVAWLVHARTRLRTAPDEAATLALAFDTWAQSVARAPGGRTGTFGADLGEALFAARALRRHVTMRALGEDAVPPGALDGLAQALSRAPRRPWPVHARWVRGRLEVGERALDRTEPPCDTDAPT